MKVIAICVFSALLSGSALALDVPKLECEPKADAVGCFIDTAKLSHALCSMDVLIGILKVQVEQAGGERPGNIYGGTACISDYRTQIVPFYSAARTKLANKEAADAALKDAYAFWLSSMTGLVPKDETMSEYKARVRQASTGLEERLNRLEVEL